MTLRAHNIVRSFWRSIEILIFFSISVAGFTILFRTTSFNAKAKDRSFCGGSASGAGLAGSYRALPIPDRFAGNRTDLSPLTSERETLSASNPSTTPDLPALCYALPLIEKQLATVEAGQKGDCGIFNSPLHEPHNLVQQNPTLLI
ncbi:MAG: hypothetical protein WCH05_00665 [Chlorobiaceae bacterium]